jgi:hypothetical protein
VQCTNDTFELHEPSQRQAPSIEILTGAQDTFYVDYIYGSDSNAGTITSPFKTLLKGIFFFVKLTEL